MIYRINIPYRKLKLELPDIWQAAALIVQFNCHHFSSASPHIYYIKRRHTVAAGHGKALVYISLYPRNNLYTAGSCWDYILHSTKQLLKFAYDE